MVYEYEIEYEYQFSNFKPMTFPEPSFFMFVLGRERVAHEMRWVCVVIM